MRRTTLAARLKAVYGTVDKVDAFVGMVSEPHLRRNGARAAAARDLEAAVHGPARRRPLLLRNDPRSSVIALARTGITYRHTLAELVKLDTGASVAPNVFVCPELDR